MSTERGIFGYYLLFAVEIDGQLIGGEGVGVGKFDNCKFSIISQSFE